MPEVTLLVPTRNESGNIRELVDRVDLALGSRRAELLFVDDSDDDTPEVIRAVASHASRPIRLLHREPEGRIGGLGGAVVAGLKLVMAPVVVVLDGDLQHPPEVIPQLLDVCAVPGIDLVGASRYQNGRDGAGLDGRLRALVSTLCTLVTRLLFRNATRGLSDPMSGFFAVRVQALDLATLRPSGYKILLEILVRSRLAGTAEVPYKFQPRSSGTSKASLQQGLHFLRHVALLRVATAAGRTRQIAVFLGIGLTGVAVNTALLWLMTASAWRLPYLLASVVATHIAMCWNFCLLSVTAFRGYKHDSVVHRFARFWLVNVGLLPVQLALLALLVDGLSASTIVSNVLTLAVVFLLRYALSSGWVYRGAPAALVGAPPAAGAIPAGLAGLTAEPTLNSHPSPVATPVSTSPRARREWWFAPGLFPMRFPGRGAQLALSLALVALVPAVVVPTAFGVRAWLAAATVTAAVMAAVFFAVLFVALRTRALTDVEQTAPALTLPATAAVRDHQTRWFKGFASALSQLLHARSRLVAARSAPRLRSAGFAARIALPLLLTAAVFPETLESLSHVRGVGVWLEFGAVCGSAAIIVACRVAPAPGEPDVHDRQLDVILSVPLLAVALWLSLSWHSRSAFSTPIGDRGMVAVTAFLVAAALLLWGTRLTARLRWVLCAPLLGMSLVRHHRDVTMLLVAVFVGVALASLLRYRRRQRRVPGSQLPTYAQALPPLRYATGVTVGVAILLGSFVSS